MALDWAAFGVVIGGATIVCGMMWKLFGRLEGRFDRFADHVDQRFAEQGVLYGGALDRLAAEMDRGTELLDGRLERVEGRLERVEGRLEGLSGEMAAHTAGHAA